MVRVKRHLSKDQMIADQTVLLPASATLFSTSSQLCGAQVEQVGEHLSPSCALFIFEHKCYPEAKILSSLELKALHQDVRSWHKVAELVGASEAFVRQNTKK